MKNKWVFCREHSERQAAIDSAITKAYREYKVRPPISFQMQNMAITHHVWRVSRIIKVFKDLQKAFCPNRWSIKQGLGPGPASFINWKYTNKKQRMSKLQLEKARAREVPFSWTRLCIEVKDFNLSHSPEKSDIATFAMHAYEIHIDVGHLCLFRNIIGSPSGFGNWTAQAILLSGCSLFSLA